MTREKYINNRNSNSVTAQDLYETLKLNKTFKIASYEEFAETLKVLEMVSFNNEYQNILLKEYRRLNDIKFDVQTLHYKNGKEINFYRRSVNPTGENDLWDVTY